MFELVAMILMFIILEVTAVLGIDKLLKKADEKIANGIDKTIDYLDNSKVANFVVKGAVAAYAANEAIKKIKGIGREMNTVGREGPASYLLRRGRGGRRYGRDSYTSDDMKYGAGSPIYREIVNRYREKRISDETGLIERYDELEKKVMAELGIKEDDIITNYVDTGESKGRVSGSRIERDINKNQVNRHVTMDLLHELVELHYISEGLSPYEAHVKTESIIPAYIDVSVKTGDIKPEDAARYKKALKEKLDLQPKSQVDDIIKEQEKIYREISKHFLPKKTGAS